MDVLMPDGTTITGVPEGITQSDLLARYNKFSTMQPAAKPARSAFEPTLSPEEQVMGAVGAPGEQVPAGAPAVKKPPSELAIGEELGKGVGAGAIGLQSMWENAGVMKDVGVLKTVKDRLDLFNKIETGQITSPDQLRGLDQTTSQARAYFAADPAMREKMRARNEGEIGRRTDFVKASIDTLAQYQKDAEKYKGRTTDLTDVEGAKDFANWLSYNMGSGAVQMAPIMLAAATTGPAGVAVLGAGMGTSEAVGNRLEFLQDKIKNLPPDQKAQAVIDYVQKTGDTSLAVGIISGAMDSVLGPAATLAKRGLGEVVKGETRKQALKAGIKELPKQMGEEFLTGGAQEATQIAGAVREKEKEKFLTEENLKQILNAAAAEAAGAVGGGGASTAARVYGAKGVPTPEAGLASLVPTTEPTVAPVANVAPAPTAPVPTSVSQDTDAMMQELLAPTIPAGIVKPTPNLQEEAVAEEAPAEAPTFAETNPDFEKIREAIINNDKTGGGSPELADYRLGRSIEVADTFGRPIMYWKEKGEIKSGSVDTKLPRGAQVIGTINPTQKPVDINAPAPENLTPKELYDRAAKMKFMAPDAFRDRRITQEQYDKILADYDKARESYYSTLSEQELNPIQKEAFAIADQMEALGQKPFAEGIRASANKNTVKEPNLEFYRAKLKQEQAKAPKAEEGIERPSEKWDWNKFYGDDTKGQEKLKLFNSKAKPEVKQALQTLSDSMQAITDRLNDEGYTMYGPGQTNVPEDIKNLRNQIQLRSAEGSMLINKFEALNKGFKRSKTTTNQQNLDAAVQEAKAGAAEAQKALQRSVPEPEEVVNARAAVKEANKRVETLEYKSGSLWSALLGKLDPEEVREIFGPNPSLGEKKLQVTKKSGRRGTYISEMADNGLLDAFLPPGMRRASGRFDAAEASQYIKDAVANKDYLPDDVKEEIKNIYRAVEPLGDLIDEYLTIEEQNRELQIAFDEQREADQAAQVFEPEGENRPAKPSERPARELELTAPTADELKAKQAEIDRLSKENERLAKEAERKAKADEAAKEFVLTGSEREADQAAARGQKDIFAEAPKEEKPKDNKQEITDLRKEQKTLMLQIIKAGLQETPEQEARMDEINKRIAELEGKPIVTPVEVKKPVDTRTVEEIEAEIQDAEDELADEFNKEKRMVIIKRLGQLQTDLGAAEYREAVEAEKIPAKTYMESLEKAGFDKLPRGSARTYKDAGGKEYTTLERYGVRVAIQSGTSLHDNGKGGVDVYQGDPNEWTLQALIVNEDRRRQGFATKTMQDITDLADQFDIDLYLEPKAIQGGKMSSKQLTKFYEQFGFIPEGKKLKSGVVMFREAAKEEGPQSTGSKSLDALRGVKFTPDEDDKKAIAIYKKIKANNPEADLDEVIANPNRPLPIEEKENAKGIKIGDLIYEKGEPNPTIAITVGEDSVTTIDPETGRQEGTKDIDAISKEPIPFDFSFDFGYGKIDVNVDRWMRRPDEWSIEMRGPGASETGYLSALGLQFKGKRGTPAFNDYVEQVVRAQTKEMAEGGKKAKVKKGGPSLFEPAMGNIEKLAKDYNGKIVFGDDNMGLVLAYGEKTGEPLYVPYVGNAMFRNDIEQFPASSFKMSDADYKKLVDAKQKLEKEATEKHNKTPFLKIGEGVTASKGIPGNVLSVAKGWSKMLNLTGNIHIMTDEEALADKDKFTGPHRAIGYIGFLGEPGMVKKVGPTDHIIVIRKSTSTGKTLEVLAHELGHIHEKQAFDNADTETKNAVIREFNKWFDKSRAGTAGELVESMRAKRMAQTTKGDLSIPAMQMQNRQYWLGFREWYADQVSRWATTDAKPVGVVEQFFSRLGKAIRSFFGKAQAAKYLPNETFVEYLNKVTAVEDLSVPENPATGEQIPLFALESVGNAPPKTPRRNYEGGEAPEAAFDSPDESKMDTLIYKLQDKNIDTKRVIEAIEKTSGEIDENWDVYKKEETYHGRLAKRTEDFLDKELMPIFKEMKANGVSLEDLEKYLLNRHAEEANEQIAKINPERPDKGSSVATEDARKYLAGLTDEQRATYDSLASKIDEIIKGTQKVLVDNGLEKKSVIDEWNKTYEHYVPLERDNLDFVQSGRGVMGGFGTRGSASKRRVGSEKDVINIFANIALQRERALRRSEQARVGRALYGLAIQNPNPDFWLPINPDAIKDKEKLVAELENMGLRPEDAKNIIQEPKEPQFDRKTGLVRYQVNPLLRNSPNVFPIRINGEDRFIIFNPNDPRAKRMVESLKNLDGEQLGAVLGTIGMATRWIASVNTQYNPVFGAWNFARDVQGAALNLSTTELAGKEKQVLKNTWPALFAVYRDLRGKEGKTQASKDWIDMFERYQLAGGQTGYQNQFSETKKKANIVERELARLDHGTARKAAESVFKWLSDYNDAMENSVRLAAFKVAVEQGMSDDAAASLAKNLTVNFNRKGASSPILQSLYAFFNAAVQGNARLIQTLRGPAGKKIIIGGMVIGAFQAIALAMAGFDDDEPPDFVKDKNLVIPIGDGKFLTIPMPLGFNVFPGLGRLAMEALLIGTGDIKSRKGAASKVASAASLIVDSFNPLGAGSPLQMLTPTVADPIAAIATNRDAFGRPISKEDRATAPTPGYERSRENASFFSQKLAEALNWLTSPAGSKHTKGWASPTADQIDYLIGQYTGGVGREIMKTGETIKSFVTKEEQPIYRVPVLGKLYGETGTPAAISSKFYGNVTAMAEHEHEVKMRQKARESISEYYKENPEARLWQRANYIENQITRLNKEKKMLRDRGAPDDQIKRKEDQKIMLMKGFNDQVKKAQ